jgi:uncharacterized membrane protein YhaH (DUF805 family)
MPDNESDYTIAIIALSAFALALGIHIVTLFSDVSRGMPITFILFAVALLSFGALILTIHRRARERGQQRATIADMLAPLPSWARVLCSVAIVYSVANFALFMRASEGGAPEQQPDGQYYLDDHGRFIRPLDEGGLREFRTWEVRLFSGHSLPFLVLPGLYFLFASRRPEVKDELSSPAP